MAQLQHLHVDEIRNMNTTKCIDILIEVFKYNRHSEPNNSIDPERDKIETTAMVAKRKLIALHAVVHHVDWSDLFHRLPNPTHWRFNPNCKQKLKNRPNDDAWTIPVLSPTECEKLIELTELYGYENVGYDPNYRSNTRTISNDPFFAANLFERIKQCCPSTLKSDGQIWQICGLNEQFRWCRYSKGQKFGMHCDARFIRSETEKSFYTVNVYLNDGVKHFKGGKTLFWTTNETKWIEEVNESVTAKPGLALIFNQHPSEIYHSGEKIYDGVKYLMRTDVMYKSVLSL